MTIIQTVLGFIAAVITVVILGAASHAIINQGDLAAIGAQFTAMERIQWIGHDIVGMGPLYGAIMGVGLFIGFIVAGFVARIGLRPIVYIVAGAVAVVVSLIVVGMAFPGGVTPIASTRELDGLIGQAIAGALAGLAYVLVKPKAA